MSNNGKSVAQRNKAIRQEALREQLAAQGHHQHLVKNIREIQELDPNDEKFTQKLAKHKTAAELQFKLLGKYLPDLKSAEITGTIEQNVSVNTNQLAGEVLRQVLTPPDVEAQLH